MDPSNKCENSPIDNALSEENHVIVDEGSCSKDSYDEKVRYRSTTRPNDSKIETLFENVDKRQLVKRNIEPESVDGTNDENLAMADETVFQLKQLNRMFEGNESRKNGIGLIEHGVIGNAGCTFTSHLSDDIQISSSNDCHVQNRIKDSEDDEAPGMSGTSLSKETNASSCVGYSGNDKEIIEDNKKSDADPTFSEVQDDLNNDKSRENMDVDVFPNKFQGSIGSYKSANNERNNEKTKDTLDPLVDVSLSSDDGESLTLTEEVNENEIKQKVAQNEQQEDGIKERVTHQLDKNQGEKCAGETSDTVRELKYRDKKSKLDKKSSEQCNDEENTEKDNSLFYSGNENCTTGSNPSATISYDLCDGAETENIVSLESNDNVCDKTIDESNDKIVDTVDIGDNSNLDIRSENEISDAMEKGVDHNFDSDFATDIGEQRKSDKKRMDLRALCEASGITDEMEEDDGYNDPSMDISMHLSVAVTEGDDVVVIDDDDQPQEKVQDTSEKSSGEGMCIIPDQVTAASIQAAWKSLTKNRKRARSRSGSDDPAEKLGAGQVSGRPQRKAAKKAESQIKEIVTKSENVFGGLEDVEQLKKEVMWNCIQCGIYSSCKFLATLNDKTVHICNEGCVEKIRKMVNARMTDNEKGSNMQVIRKCAHCRMHKIVRFKSLSWETMDFCDEDCLNRYQTKLGSHCAKCKRSVQAVNMGKYSVRFGTNVKQFCRGACLEEFKRTLKACSYCQKDITNEPESFLAPIGERLLFKDFCSEHCMKLYNHLNTNDGLSRETETCAVCSNFREVKIQLCVGDNIIQFCGQVCFSAYKYANKIGLSEKCEMCKKHFAHGALNTCFMFYEDALRHFCSTPCINAYVLMKRKIVACGWCKVKKYNFDMICKAVPEDESISMCSVNCYILSQIAKNASTISRVKCDFCKMISLPQYKQNMSDNTSRNFCSYSCVSMFKGRYNPKDRSSQVTPLGASIRFSFDQNDEYPPAQKIPSAGSTNNNIPKIPLNAITANTEINVNSGPLKPTSSTTSKQIFSTNGKIHARVLVKPQKPNVAKNKSTQCKLPITTMNSDREVVLCATTETQTDGPNEFVVPVPFPIYIPMPTFMYTAPCPVALPLPIPIPVPVFIPTTKNSYKGIMEEIQNIRERTPDHPYEADLLRMAELLADERTVEELDNDPDDIDGTSCKGDDEVPFRNTIPDTPLDLEAELSSNTIKPDLPPPPTSLSTDNKVTNGNKRLEIGGSLDTSRSRKRQGVTKGNSTLGSNKRSKRSTSSSLESSSKPITLQPIIPTEKPDAKMCLKYTYGVNGWISWIRGKNEEIQKAGSKIKLLSENLLELTADQLNYLLSQFIKEFKKPNGTDYAPDTIYYLCLGIQHYLYDNGRVDNIFCDPFYEGFNKTLDEIISRFPETYENSQVVVTRVVEEHLWESRQLGAHSPYVLLFTLMFYNTKYFNLSITKEHEQISFSHIMKHWKRGPNQISTAGSSTSGNTNSPPSSTGKIPNGTSSSKNVVLRFYPPQSEIESNVRKKKVYEQHANELDPLRCPVKLYEFYLSKCPDCMKTRNDVFYLAPERSCAPESPVWYSTVPLSKDLLNKMLNRVKIVKEINIALLTSL